MSLLTAYGFPPTKLIFNSGTLNLVKTTNRPVPLIKIVAKLIIVLSNLHTIIKCLTIDLIRYTPSAAYKGFTSD